MKRGLMPCVQAGMQLPLPLHTSLQRIAVSFPSPPVIRSTIAPAVSLGSAAEIPPGSVIGQARKQSPQRVQASAIASARWWKTPRKSSVAPIPAGPVSIAMWASFIGRPLNLYQPGIIQRSPSPGQSRGRRIGPETIRNLGSGTIIVTPCLHSVT
jgi:hypothetical protein